ncbi:MAG: glycosyltransferase family 9 protein [Aphanocapsa sp. GSE-SYN-MK-11-07L]|jgi:ADP-heptose:LPS heptosyltransferase|nr:glycosyltransferase family 9 protein [Aphanocapsa sp. GSE-SYN-MK-11-07L]
MKRILALVPGGISDQILFFPSLDDLKTQLPKAELDVVVEPRATSAYRVSHAVNKVIPFNFGGQNGPADWLNLLGILREQEYDAVMSLGTGWSVGLLMWLLRVPSRIGYTTGKPMLLLTDSVLLNPDQYVAVMYHDLLQGLGMTSACPPIAIQVPKPDIEWADNERAYLGLASSGYLLIDGGASQLTPKGINQIYPIASWQKVISEFQRRQPDLPIVLVQGTEDAEWIAAMLHESPDLKVTAPGDVGKLAAMIAGASLMLCTDSASMQLGVAVQTYLVALFGSTDPDRLLPKSDRFIGIKSPTGDIADIPPAMILEQAWRG